MATYEPKHEVPPPASAHTHDAHELRPEDHHPFGDWVPENSVMGAAINLMHMVDPDLHTAHTGADPAVQAKGAAYAKQLVGLRDTPDSAEHYKMINLLESVTDPAVRHEMMAQFEAQTGQSLSGFINHADWDGKRDKSEALALISPERDKANAKLASMSPEEQADVRREAFESAEKFLKVAGKDDANDAGNARQMADAFAGKSPEQIEAIRQAIQTSTHGQQGTYELIDRALNKEHEDEAVAALHGTGLNATVAALTAAKDDPKRMREIIGRLDAVGRTELMAMGPVLSTTLIANLPEGERKEMQLRISGSTAKADAARITDLLSDETESFARDRFSGASATNMFAMGPDIKDQLDHTKMANEADEDRKPKNVLRELEGMSPEELKAAREAYDPNSHGGKSWDQMIQDRFGKDVDGKRIAMVLAGDRVGDRALELQEGMKKHDQKEIEHALSNSDLASKDPATHARGLADQQQLAARMFVMGGGRTIDQQLAASTTELLDGPSDNPMLALDAMKNRHSNEEKSKDWAVADQELLYGGKLSTATQARRAPAQERAEMLESLSPEELDQAKRDYKAKYGKDLLEGPDLDKYIVQARNIQMNALMRGEGDMTLEQAERKAALDDMDVNELRMDKVRSEGVKSQRSEDQLVADQKDIYAKQHSDRLDEDEQRREQFGYGVGSQKLYRESIAAMDEKNRANHWSLWMQGKRADDDDVRQLDHVATGEQQTAREEKIALAERSSKVISKVTDVVADLFPEAAPAIKAIGGLVNVYEKKQIGGEAIDTNKELAEVGIEVGATIIGDKITGEGGDEAKKALKAAEKTGDEILIGEAKNEVRKEMVRKGAGAAAESYVKAKGEEVVKKHIDKDKPYGYEGKTDEQMGVEAIFSGLSAVLPDSFNEKIAEGLGDFGKTLPGKGIGKLVEKTTDKSLDAMGEKLSGKKEEEKQRGSE